MEAGVLHDFEGGSPVADRGLGVGKFGAEASVVVSLVDVVGMDAVLTDAVVCWFALRAYFSGCALGFVEAEDLFVSAGSTELTETAAADCFLKTGGPWKLTSDCLVTESDRLAAVADNAGEVSVGVLDHSLAVLVCLCFAQKLQLHQK